MNILIKTDNQAKRDSFVGKIKEIFPQSFISVVGIHDNYPKKNFDVCFLGNEPGWDDYAKDISGCTKNLYMVTNDEDYTLYADMDKFKIKEILNYDNTTQELSSILAQHVNSEPDKIFDSSFENPFDRDQYIKKLNTIDFQVQDFKLSTHLIAVTGSKGGTGKTATTINLGASLAKQGNVVLIIDMDTTKNTSSVADRLHLGYGNAKTVKDFIDGNVQETDKNVFIPHEIEGLYILPSPGHEKEAKNLTRGVIKDILQFASPLFDVVIVDLPHSLLSPMSIVLEFCDVGYIVVDQLGEGLRTIANWNLLKNYIFPKLKLIVNNASSTKNSEEFQIVLEQLLEEKKLNYLCNIRYDEKFIRSLETGKIPSLDFSCSKYREDFKKVTNDALASLAKKSNNNSRTSKNIFSKIFSR
ncbi:AAA family ATPase [Acetivibrio cellulolyticus]|uniref:AAA family ATPase n=1 Tax=Acetivibrio cellulolyticus TaxID=35830 RepID=UPI0001E2C2D0|nr:ParA family protein [Acetivibrio cellulolyticus]